MSFFSHNPEKWDEIERRGVALYLAAHMQDDGLIEDLAEALCELQLASESQAAWKELTRLAHKEIDNEQQDFWGSFAL